MAWVQEVLDDFNRANGNIANSWTGNPDPAFQISGNKVSVLTDAGGTQRGLAPTAALTDMKVSAKVVTNGTATSAGLGVRFADASVSGYAVALLYQGVYIRRWTNGSVVDIAAHANIGGLPATEYILSLEVIGTSLTARVALASDPNTNLDTLTVTDATYASGKGAINPSEAGGSVDDFRVFSYVEVFTLTPSPTTVHTDGRNKSITLTCAEADWLTSAPDIEVTAGTVVSTVVNSDTEAVIVYNAPNTAQTVTITDNTAPAEGTIAIQSPIVAYEGNSLTTLDYAPYVTYVTDGLTVEIEDYNVAVSAEKLSDMLATYDDHVQPKYNADARKNIVVITLCATNDFYFERAIEDVQADWIAYCAAAHADGFLVLCSTETDRRNVDTPVGWRADIEAWNTWMRSTGRTYADGFADIAAEPLLGADGASDNTTYFNADKVHFNNTGAQLAADIVIPELQRLLTGGGSSSVIGGGFGGLIIGA